MQTRTRRKDLDCAKGLGILLVVIGHIVPASAAVPMGNIWYEHLRAILYEFHMPFFMYLSGYVTFLSGAAHTSVENWPTLVKKRVTRLLLPFLIFGLVIVGGKWLASQAFHVDNMPGSISQAMFGLIWNTDYSPVTSVWYIAVLFVFCVATPPLFWLSRNRVLPLVALAGVLYMCPIPHVLYLNRVATYYIFFMLGGLCFQHEALWLTNIDRFTGLALAVFLITVVLFIMPLTDDLDWKAKMLIAGVLSMPALHGLIRRPLLLESSTLLRLGEFSFVIYLLNTPCIGLIKGAGFQILPWDGYDFLLYALLLTLGGTIGPIFIKKFVLRPIPAIDRMTD